MTDPAPFQIDRDLPEAILADAPAAAVAALVRASGGVWLRGRPEDFPRAPDGAPEGWSAGDDRRAIPTDPAQGQVIVAEAEGQAGLVCRTGLHGGMVLTDLAPGRAITLAVVWHPHRTEPARTLLCLNPSAAGGAYLFLSHGEDGFTLKDTAEQAVLTVPDARRDGAPARMLVVSAGPSGLALWQDGGAVVRAPAEMDPLPARADLFIGCRSQRRGLAKTLGASLIREVIVLPGQQALSDETGPALAALAAHFRWGL